MKKTFTLMCTLLVVMLMSAHEQKEYKLYTTNFQDWESVSNSTTEKSKVVTTRGSKEQLTISWLETEIRQDGTNSKFTADVITKGYAMAAKTANPYIRTSALKNITKVEYVHAATGGNRGWGLRMRTAGETEWTTLSSAYCQQAGTKVTVSVNKENVELEWYNLASDQNAYMTEFTIYGMAEDDGEPEEYKISYFDQNGEKVGEKVQTEDETLQFAYTETDLSIAEGQKFRGWFTSDGVKMRGGETLTGDMRLHAVVTPVETATETARYEYDLTKATFYEEDHECFVPTEGSYYNEHGWVFQSSGSVSLPVSDKAYIILGMCKYSKGNMSIKTEDGTEVATLEAAVATDGKKDTVFYAGGATTLKITFGGTTYLHYVAIYNVRDEVRKNEQGWWQIPAGDGNGLLLALGQLENGDKVFLPNGLYDFGETVLTQVSKNNVSIIGESMEGTIIRNAPDASTESINNTATLLVTGTNTYLQDLTLQNALDYYKADNGRAVCLQDKGTKTICKNVRMLSYQDTYYSNKIGGLHYFDGGSIHGTVDYICGDGSTFFNEVELYCEKRASKGGGTDAVTASNADKSDKGYVFYNCTLRSECPTVSLGRAWNNLPQTVFINTTVDYSAGKFGFSDSGIQRWTKELMNKGAFPKFGEYNTRDTEGTLLTPESNVVKFVDTKDGSKTQEVETVLTEKEVAGYLYDTFFGSAWNPAQETKPARLEVKKEGNLLKWESNGTAYLVYVNGVLATMTTDTEYEVEDGDEITVRAANGRGGFGVALKAGEATGVEQVPFENGANMKVKKILADGQLLVELPDGRVYNMLGAEVK